MRLPGVGSNTHSLCCLFLSLSVCVSISFSQPLLLFSVTLPSCTRSPSCPTAQVAFLRVPLFLFSRLWPSWGASQARKATACITPASAAITTHKGPPFLVKAVHVPLPSQPHAATREGRTSSCWACPGRQGCQSGPRRE